MFLEITILPYSRREFLTLLPCTFNTQSIYFNKISTLYLLPILLKKYMKPGLDNFKFQSNLRVKKNQFYVPTKKLMEQSAKECLP